MIFHLLAPVFFESSLKVTGLFIQKHNFKACVLSDNLPLALLAKNNDKKKKKNYQKDKTPGTSLRAITVTRGWNRYRNKSQHRTFFWRRKFQRRSYHFRRDKSMQTYFCRDKSMQTYFCRDKKIFVATKVLARWQAYFCRNKRRVLSRQKCRCSRQ